MSHEPHDARRPDMSHEPHDARHPGMSHEPNDIHLLTDEARARPESAYELASVGGETGDAAVAARIAAAMLGAALAALDDHDALVRSRVTGSASLPPDDPETDHRRRLGMAIGRLEAASCILDEAVDEPADETRLWMLSREVTRLAYTTVQELILHSGGSIREPGPEAGRLGAIVASMTRLWGHPVGALDDAFSRRVARERLRLA